MTNHVVAGKFITCMFQGIRFNSLFLSSNLISCFYFLSLALIFSLYENNTLSDVDKAVFDDFDSDNNGVGSVENTNNDNDWRCYRLESTTQDIIASIA